ncbi:MAG: UDP-2,3-diacylglucosamine diphosphatase [Pseudomonadota bacterium]|nr:UDP-2,3-diacylglucosamine diphosphatase [Pseudomonadota bacterium]
MATEIIFTADVHLAPQQPQIVEQFLTFLTQRATQAQKLYILGDLFETWIGDDEDEPFYQTIIQALHTLVDADVAVLVMPGNRDFLLSIQFAQLSGCQLIADPSVVDIWGTPALLMHGDSLCLDDVAYQRFRQQVRHPAWQQQFLAQPLSQRRLLAQHARIQSQTHTQKTPEPALEVTPAAVITALETHKVFELIHGHTHRPRVEQLALNGQPAYRRVVGAWHTHGATVLSCTPQQWQLIEINN